MELVINRVSKKYQSRTVVDEINVILNPGVIGLLMSIFAMCLSQLCKSSVAVIAIMMGFWLISMLNPPYSMRIVSQAASFLPVTFLGSWTFSDYRMIGLFGHMFNILQIAPMLYLILSVIFARITRISYNKYQVER